MSENDVGQETDFDIRKRASQAIAQIETSIQ